MEQTLGFRKQTPLRGLPEGPQLRAQREEQDFLRGLTPQQREIRLATKVGTKTQEQITKEDQLFQQNLESGKLQLEALRADDKTRKRIEANVDRALQKYPTLGEANIKTTLSDYVRKGTPIDPDFITAVQADPGAKQLFDIAYQLELTKYKNELDVRLARSRSPGDEMQLLRVLTEMGNQLNDQQGKILLQMQSSLRALEDEAKNPLVSGMKYLQNPNLYEQEKATITNTYQKQLDDLNKSIEQNRMQVQKLSEKYGAVPMPQMATPQQPVGPVNETPEQRRARLRRAAGLMP